MATREMLVALDTKQSTILNDSLSIQLPIIHHHEKHGKKNLLSRTRTNKQINKYKFFATLIQIIAKKDRREFEINNDR